MKFKVVTKDEAFEKLKKSLGNAELSEKLLEDFDSNFLPVSFLIKLKEGVLIEDFYNEFKTNAMVDAIRKAPKNPE